MTQGVKGSFNYEVATARVIEGLQPDNADLMQRWLASLKAKTSPKTGEGLKPKTIYGYVQMVGKLLKGIGPFSEWTVEDLEAYFASASEYNISKPEAYKGRLRILLNWLRKREDDNDERARLRKLKTVVEGVGAVVRDLKKEDILTPRDVEEILRACGKTAYPDRNRATFATLYESLARPKELLDTNYGDVELADGYAIIYLRESKTKQRAVPVIDATPYLREWLRVHPRKEEDAPLFVSFNHRNLHGRLGERSLLDILKDVIPRTNLKPRAAVGNSTGRDEKGKSKARHRGITPYLFRHSGITWHLYELGLAPLAVARKAGTSLLMIEKTYGKWGRSETVDPYLQTRGAKEPKKEPGPAFRLAVCPVCGTDVPIDTTICTICDFVFDPRIRRRQEKDEAKQEAMQSLLDSIRKLADNPQSVKALTLLLNETMKRPPETFSTEAELEADIEEHGVFCKVCKEEVMENEDGAWQHGGPADHPVEVE